MTPRPTPEAPPALPAPPDPWSSVGLPPDRSQNAWLISYLDVLLLLVTLLVVLLALQRDRPDQTAAIETEPSRAADAPTRPSPQAASVVPVPPPVPSLVPMRPPLPAPPVPRPVAASVSPGVRASADVPAPSARRDPTWDVPEDLHDQVDVIRESEQVRLEVNDAILFETGSAELKAEGVAVLERLAEMLGTHEGRISVEGHTDDRPITTVRYPSNWELSAARASTVVRHLIRLGLPASRMQAIGYADTRPRAPNRDETGRARNRRVTLVLYPPSPPP